MTLTLNGWEGRLVKWVLVLGCYGLLVGSASAGERWPAGPCKDTQQQLVVEEQLAAKFPSLTAADRVSNAAILASIRHGLLPLLRDHCAADVRAKITQDNASFDAEAARLEHDVQTSRTRRAPTSTPPRPILCDTTPKADGGSYTDCF